MKNCCLFCRLAQNEVNQVHIGGNQSKLSPQSVVCVCVFCAKIGLHGCKAKAQQPRTSGLALWCISSANMHPRQAATRWMTCYQSNTPWQTSGHLQLTHNRHKKPVSALFNHLHLVKTHLAVCRWLTRVVNISDPLKMVFTHQRLWNCRNP